VKEATIESKIRLYALSKGCLCYKFVSPSHRGVPDRLILLPGGRAAFIEVKAPGKKPSALQKVELARLISQGIPAIYADSFETAKAFLDDLLA
jgi:hypothetical protein